MTPSDESLELAEALQSAVGDLVRRLRAEPGTLPSGQAAALGYLVRVGELSVADLAGLERVRHQSMTRTIKLLESQGLVELRPDQVDRRRVMVTVLPAGKATLERLRRRRSTWIARAIEAELDPTERAVLRRFPGILSKLSTPSTHQE